MLPASLLHLKVGRYKTWTLDSGLDYGLDFGLDWTVIDLLFDFECWIARDWPNCKNGHVCSFYHDWLVGLSHCFALTASKPSWLARSCLFKCGLNLCKLQTATELKLIQMTPLSRDTSFKKLTSL